MRADLYIGKDYKTLYHQLIAGFYDALILTDPDGHIMDISPRAIEFFGYRPEKLLDLPISTLIPGVTPSVVDRIKSGFDESRRMLLTALCKRKDESEFPGEIAVSPIDLDTKGNIIFSIRNIERRKKQWRQMRSKSNAFEVSQCACFCCDEQGEFRSVNQAFLEMFGLTEKEDVIGKSFRKIIADDPLPELFEQALAGESQTYRLSAESQDGMIMLEFKMKPDVQEKGRIVGVVGSIAQI